MKFTSLDLHFQIYEVGAIIVKPDGVLQELNNPCKALSSVLYRKIVHVPSHSCFAALAVFILF